MLCGCMLRPVLHRATHRPITPQTKRMKKYLFISSFLYALVVLFSTGGCSRESPVEPIAAPPVKTPRGRA